MQLSEKYRPKSWTEIVGQEKAVQNILRIKETSGLRGKAFWIAGKSGQGKTTIAKLIASEIADEFYIDELDAGELTVSRLADIERGMQTYGGGKGGKVFIVNEAHGLKKAVIRQFLVLLERLPKHCTFIFTTTTDGMSMFEDDNMDANPFLSRTIEIALAQRGLAEAFAQRASEIAKAENLDGKPLAKYVRLANDCGGNMRMMLSKIESGLMLKGND